MTAPDARRPDPSEAPPYFAGYLATVPDGSLLDTLQGTGDALAAWIARRTAAQLAGRPAPGKWTVGEALQHVLDPERDGPAGGRHLHRSRAGGVQQSRRGSVRVVDPAGGLRYGRRPAMSCR